ncbi:hypothetical protein [Streptomyces sp. NPDC088733]|uniref:hypothetical protein n=1 Tax=Streptomyces sp. NPDC088733 TaxID=3365880 RepID=UPI00382C742F
MRVLILLFAAFVVFVVPTALVWLLGQRARVPDWMMLIVFLPAGWLTVFVGGFLWQRAQLSLFPEASPCYGTSGAVSQYFPPDSFCLHQDGELRTVNGPNAKLVFWTAANTTLATAVAAAFARHRHGS